MWAAELFGAEGNGAAPGEIVGESSDAAIAWIFSLSASFVEGGR